jgi:hypothetical protein
MGCRPLNLPPQGLGQRLEPKWLRLAITMMVVMMATMMMVMMV